MNPTLSRRRALQSALSMGGAALAALPAATAVAQGAARFTPNTASAMTLTQQWDKVFPQSPKVDHQKVTFQNRYGITLAADLYLPKQRAAGRLPAVVVGGPFGAVKEQVSGLYAQMLAERDQKVVNAAGKAVIDQLTDAVARQK